MSWRVSVLHDSFFFFQAEDGIRYWSVTGVQTCALPIYQHLLRVRSRPDGDEVGAIEHAEDAGALFHGRRGGDQLHVEGRRSGESRVGKEGGSRGAAYD